MSNVLTISGIHDVIKEEIAKAASRIIDEGGNPLYDALVNYSNDTEELNRAIANALSSVESTFSDIIISVGTDSITFNLPDHPSSFSEEENDLKTVIADDVVIKWFRRRGRADVADILTAERDAGLERLQHNLYRRKPVSRN